MKLVASENAGKAALGESRRGAVDETLNDGLQALLMRLIATKEASETAFSEARRGAIDEARNDCLKTLLVELLAAEDSGDPSLGEGTGRAVDKTFYDRLDDGPNAFLRSSAMSQLWSSRIMIERTGWS